MLPTDERVNKPVHGIVPIVGMISLLILYLFGALFPSIFTWGFQSFGFLPWYCYPVMVMLLGIAAVLLLKEEDPRLRRLLDAIGRHQAMFFLLLLLAFTALSYILRVRAPLLGDGFFLVKNFSEAFHGSAPIYYRDEPLATAYFQGVFLLFGFPSTYLGFLQGYLLAELFLEVGFITIVFFTLRVMSDNSTVRALGMLSVVAMPYMQLFFGYVETYSVMLVVLSIYIFVAVLTLRGKVSFWLLPSCFLLLFLTHYMTALLIPSLLYIGYREIRRKGWQRVTIGFALAACILLIILFEIHFDIDPYTTTVPHNHYLSLFGSTNPFDADTEAYTLFSPYHLSDLINYFILMGMPALLMIAVLLPGKKMLSSLQREMKLFFVIALLPLLCGIVLIKFDLGAVRDWDVFVAYFYMIPLLLTVQTIEFADTAAVRSIFFIILILFLHSTAYWLVNASGKATVARISTIFDRRTLSHGAYYTASLNLAQYYHQNHDDEKAVDVWKKFQHEFPDDTRAYENLILNYQKLPPPRDDDIEEVYKTWTGTLPQDTIAQHLYRNYCVDRGNANFQSGKFSDAAIYYQRAVAIDSTYANALNNLGSVYAQQGNHELAEKYFLTALRRNPQYGEAMFNLGTILADEGKINEAKEYFRSATLLHVEQATRALDSLERNSKSGDRK